MFVCLCLLNISFLSFSLSLVFSILYFAGARFSLELYSLWTLSTDGSPPSLITFISFEYNWYHSHTTNTLVYVWIRQAFNNNFGLKLKSCFMQIYNIVDMYFISYSAISKWFLYDDGLANWIGPNDKYESCECNWWGGSGTGKWHREGGEHLNGLVYAHLRWET